MRRFSFVLCCLAALLSGCRFYLPIADFSPSARAGDLPLAITFTDLSIDGGQPITNWRWDFGDGATSTAMNPVHTYTERGTYTVTLTVETPWGRDEKVMEDLIEVRQIVRFPDANLDASLRAALGIPTASIRVADLESLTVLDAAEASISNLAGLEFASNLQTLILESNAITDLSPLQGLFFLRELNLRDNQIEDIAALSPLFRLELIDLGINNVTDISPLRELGRLAKLNLERNPGLSDILPLRNKPSLRELSLGFTALSQTEEIDGLGPLGLLTGLTYLDLAANDIHDLGAISELVNLETLVLFDCQIEDIGPLADLVKLQELQLSANGIADIGVLSAMEDLNVLTLQMNQIQDITPLVSNPGLGFNDVVRLTGNPLNPDALCSGIPTLQARGVAVEVDQVCAAR